MFNIVVNGEVVGNGNSYQTTSSIFYNNANIIDVDLNYMPFKNNSMYMAFDNCTNLTNVTNINENVTNMYYTYYNCTNLVTAPIIPEGTINMWGTFYGCSNLDSDIYILSPDVSATSLCFYNTKNIRNIYVPWNSKTYNTFNSGSTKSKLKEDTIHFENSGDWYYRKTDTTILKYKGTGTSATIPDSINGQTVNKISNSIFSYDKNIQTVDFNNKEFFGNTASAIFYQCPNLISFTNANFNNVTSMYISFSGCSNLVNAPEIPNSVTDIQWTFQGCSNLVNAPVIPNSVVDMSGTFNYCSNLVNAPVIPNSVTDMKYTFSGCSNLVNAPEIPNSVTYMWGTFNGCVNLIGDININSDNIYSFGETFADCQKINNVSRIPNNVYELYRTFYNCKSMSQVPNIPNTVTNMSMTFYGCSNLTGNIYIHSEDITSVSDCFYNTSLEKNVYMPCSSTYGYTSGLYAFYNSSANYKTYYTDHNIEYPEGMVTVYDSSGNVIDSAHAHVEEDWENPMQFVLIVDDPMHGVYGGQYQFKRNSSKDVIEYIPAGGVSKTYKSFLQSGYSATSRLNGVLIFDINGQPIPEYDPQPAPSPQGSYAYSYWNEATGETTTYYSDYLIYDTGPCMLYGPTTIDGYVEWVGDTSDPWYHIYVRNQMSGEGMDMWRNQAEDKNNYPAA